MTDLHAVLAGAIAIERAAPPIMPISASTSCSAASDRRHTIHASPARIVRKRVTPSPSEITLCAKLPIGSELDELRAAGHVAD